MLQAGVLRIAAASLALHLFTAFNTLEADEALRTQAAKCLVFLAPRLTFHAGMHDTAEGQDVSMPDEQPEDSESDAEDGPAAAGAANAFTCCNATSCASQWHLLCDYWCTFALPPALQMHLLSLHVLPTVHTHEQVTTHKPGLRTLTACFRPSRWTACRVQKRPRQASRCMAWCGECRAWLAAAWLCTCQAGWQRCG